MIGAGGDAGLFVSARSYKEYVGMFGVTLEEHGDLRVLDCGSGGASFVAEWCGGGGHAIACDPLYALPLEEQAALVSSGVERAVANVVAEPDRYVWTTFGSPEQHRLERQRAAREFVADARLHPERYVPAALPRLPFEDRRFDLLLSSYLLFAYSRSISVAEHVAYAIEMSRVANELRLFPLIGFEQDATYLVDRVVGALIERGARVERQPVRYEFFRGAVEYLLVVNDLE